MIEFFPDFLIYLAVMAGVTYLVRMLPLLLVRRKITNRYIRSFLYYIPYAVLSVMTVPAIFFSTGHIISALVGFLAAMLLSYMKKSLIAVAAASCAAVLLTEVIISYIPMAL